MKLSTLAVIAAAAVLSGCVVGPNYNRPSIATPATFRAPAPLPPARITPR